MTTTFRSDNEPPTLDDVEWTHRDVSGTALDNAPDIVQAMIDWIPDRPWGPVDKVHASDLASIVYGCPYQVWLRMQGAEKREDTLGERMMFDHAHNLHADMYEAVATQLPGWRVSGEEVPCEFAQIHGSADLVLVETAGDRSVVVDLKTMRGRAFYHLEKSGPKREHVLQVRFYVAALDCDFGLLVYRDREGSNRPRQYIVTRNDEVVQDAIRKALHLYAEQPERITREAGKKMPWQCDYCRFKDLSCDGAKEVEAR